MSKVRKKEIYKKDGEIERYKEEPKDTTYITIRLPQYVQSKKK